MKIIVKWKKKMHLVKLLRKPGFFLLLFQKINEGQKLYRKNHNQTFSWKNHDQNFLKIFRNFGKFSSILIDFYWWNLLLEVASCCLKQQLLKLLLEAAVEKTNVPSNRKKIVPRNCKTIVPIVKNCSKQLL